MSTLHEDKKQLIYQKTRDILKEYAIQGITKNELCNKLAEKGICTRNTFYKYFGDLVHDNTIEVKKVGRQQKKCFPTNTNSIVEEFQQKTEIIEEVLTMVEKNSAIGDCFPSSLNNAKIPDWMEDYLPELQKNIYGSFVYRPLPYTGTDESISDSGVIPSLRARYDLLRNLPIFLTYYINNTYNEYSQQIREKCLSIVLPFVIKCITLLQREYQVPFLSDHFLEHLKQMYPDGDVSIVGINPLETDTELDFLRILGRYYFAWCCQKMNFDYNDDKHKKIIASFINSFFSQADKQVNSSKQKKGEEDLTSHDRSLASRLERSLRISDEPYIVLKHYTHLFSIGGLFDSKESIFLRERVDSLGSDRLGRIGSQEKSPHNVICYDCGVRVHWGSVKNN